MSANQPTAVDDTGASARGARLLFPVWWWVLAALALGVTGGAAIGLLHNSRHAAPLGISTLPARPVATWAAGAQRAPDFRLVDAGGAPISLSEFRGRPVIVTFIDPVCRNLCPLEAEQLNRAVAAVPAATRPVIVAISVNPWADSRSNFRQDARKWRLVPEWHWAAGRYAQLAPVWKRYKIGVLAQKKVIAGITVHEVAHTEASFVIDRAGYERALFLYPFNGDDVARTVKQLAAEHT
jgi:cytochrome oxidase Cu insertion factor (SCO1/SenC/PrrC family)